MKTFFKAFLVTVLVLIIFQAFTLPFLALGLAFNLNGTPVPEYQIYTLIVFAVVAPIMAFKIISAYKATANQNYAILASVLLSPLILFSGEILIAGKILNQFATLNTLFWSALISFGLCIFLIVKIRLQAKTQ